MAGLQQIKEAGQRVIKRVKKAVKPYYYKLRYGGRLKKKTYWLSLGENCLPDDILRRYNKKTFSTPFSSGRSNIDYLAHIEREDYAHILNEAYLEPSVASGEAVFRSTYYNKCDDIFDPTCSLGFEFTHFDPIKNPEHKKGVERKIARMKEARLKKNIIFFYHHRFTDKSDIALLRSKLDAFRQFYSNDRVRCAVILFYQSMLDKDDARKIEMTTHHDDFREYMFHTKDMWAGEDDALFWAWADEDLIKQMMHDIYKNLPLAKK